MAAANEDQTETDEDPKYKSGYAADAGGVAIPATDAAVAGDADARDADAGSGVLAEGLAEASTKQLIERTDESKEIDVETVETDETVEGVETVGDDVEGESANANDGLRLNERTILKLQEVMTVARSIGF